VTRQASPEPANHGENRQRAGGGPEGQRERIAIEITPEMVNAGMDDFHESGFADCATPSNEPIIRKILEAALARSDEVFVKNPEHPY
jgi:hypothetical protein